MSAIRGFEPFAGQHCETNTTGNLLKAAGLELSEPMLYGVGEGLAFGVFAFKGMAAPFLGGRPRPEEITQALLATWVSPSSIGKPGRAGAPGTTSPSSWTRAGWSA